MINSVTKNKSARSVTATLNSDNGDGSNGDGSNGDGSNGDGSCYEGCGATADAGIIVSDDTDGEDNSIAQMNLMMIVILLRALTLITWTKTLQYTFQHT